jgi:hypothetical protein
MAHAQPASETAGAAATAGIAPAQVVNVRTFGAAGDDKHDDTAAINRAIAYAKTIRAGRVPPSYRQAVTATVVFPPGTYKVTEPINLTGIDSIAFSIFGYGAVIDGQVSGGSVIDALGSRALKIAGISIVGSAGRTPTTGIQIGRVDDAAKSACDDTSLLDVTMDGSFSLAGLYDFACETSKFDKLTIWNVKPGGYAAIFDGINHFHVTSSFVKQAAPADTPQSFNEDLCLSCDMRVASGTPIWMSSTYRFSFGTNSYAAGTEFGMVIYQSRTETPAATDLGAGLHFETRPLADFLISGAPGRTFATISGFRYLNNGDQATQSVFALDRKSSLTGAQLARADIRIASYGSGHPTMFDQPEKWRGSGLYIGPAAPDTSWNLPPTAWSGELCISQVWTFQGTIRTPYDAVFDGKVTIAGADGLKVGGHPIVAPAFTRYTRPGQYTIAQAPGSQYLAFELWGPGGPGGNGIACGQLASCSGAGAGGAGAHDPLHRIVWADIGATRCTLLLPPAPAGGSGASARVTTMTCNGVVTRAAGGGSGANAQRGASSAGGGGASLMNPGAGASGSVAGAGGSPGGGHGGAGAAPGGNASAYAGPGGAGSSADGIVGASAAGVLAAGGGGAGGGCNAGKPMPGGDGGVTESTHASLHGVPGANGTTAWDTAGSGGAGGDAKANGATGNGGTGGVGAGGGGGGDLCGGSGQPGIGGNGGPAEALVWQE